MGEWGGFMDGGDNEKWMKALREYMIENKIAHTFWCYNANSGDTGGLVYHDFITWDEEKYALLKPALWQTSEGKFIGLDHQIPLGSNGITVTEYYGGHIPETSPTTTITPLPTPTSSPEIEKGDVNADGKVNSTDITWIKRFLLKIIEDFPAPTGRQAADMNNDGKINSTDMSILRRKILKMIE
jgi:hypothetical protein